MSISRSDARARPQATSAWRAAARAASVDDPMTGDAVRRGRVERGALGGQLLAGVGDAALGGGPVRPSTAHGAVPQRGAGGLPVRRVQLLLLAAGPGDPAGARVDAKAPARLMVELVHNNARNAQVLLPLEIRLSWAEERDGLSRDRVFKVVLACKVEHMLICGMRSAHIGGMCVEQGRSSPGGLSEAAARKTNKKELAVLHLMGCRPHYSPQSNQSTIPHMCELT
eukprot:1194550-Prorocentrum_minimum.AAC.2